MNFAAELDELKRSGLYRTLREVQGEQGPWVTLEGRRVLLLCSNNYLGLASHPNLREAAREAAERYGTSSAASRLVSGSMELHARLEERLAAFKGTEKALVFNSGYAANTGIIPALVGRGDTIFSDRLNHASIVDGALLSRATLRRYPHSDISALRRLLQRHRNGRALIVTDGVFSMDGDVAPLREIAALKEEFGALLMVDEAHGAGVLGESGRGSAEASGVSGAVDIHMGTLGKALGSFGAYAAGSAQLIDLLINRARSFIFSTSLPPSVLAASLAAVEIVDSPEGRGLREKLASNSRRFRARLLSAGLQVPPGESQIVPVLVGEAEKALAFSRLLLDEGVYVQAIRPPTVPAGTSRLRCTVTAAHAEDDLDEAAEKIAAVAGRIGLA